MSAGEALQYHLEQRGWSQKDLSDVTGRPASALNQMIKGSKDITRETATQLAAALDTTPEYWLRLQDEYKLWLLEQRPGWKDMLAAVRSNARLKNDVKQR